MENRDGQTIIDIEEAIIDNAPWPTPNELRFQNNVEQEYDLLQGMVFNDTPFTSNPHDCFSRRNPLARSLDPKLSDAVHREQSPIVNTEKDAFPQQVLQSAEICGEAKRSQIAIESQVTNVGNSGKVPQRPGKEQMNFALGTAFSHEEKMDPLALGQIKTLLLQQGEEKKVLQQQVLELSTALSHQQSMIAPVNSCPTQNPCYQAASSSPQNTSLFEKRTNADKYKAPQRRRFQKPVKIPQDYHGSQSLRDYLKHFERCAVVNGWDDEERAAFLAAGLRGDAQKVLSGLSAEDCLHYPKIVERLELRFGAEKQLQLHQARLRSRRQQPKESLQSLAIDIRSMVDLAYQDLPSHIQERFAVQHFVDAIYCKEDRFRLRVNKPKTLDDALSMARELQALHTIDNTAGESERVGTGTSFRTRTIEDSSRPTKSTPDNNSQIAELCKKIDGLQRQMSRQEESQSSLQELVGRIGLSYPSPQGLPPPGGGPTNWWSRRRIPPPQASADTECWKCREKGHYRWECPQNAPRSEPLSGNEKKTSQDARGDV